MLDLVRASLTQDPLPERDMILSPPMQPNPEDLRKIRGASRSSPAISPRCGRGPCGGLNDIYAPEAHAAALDPNTPIVLGPRGNGKSFWAGVLGRAETRAAAASAYPKLALDKAETQFGYTGIGGPDGISAEQIDAAVPHDAGIEDAKAFWWASVLSAVARSAGASRAKPKDFLVQARNWEARENC